jgi:hypothetical protein
MLIVNVALVVVIIMKEILKEIKLAFVIVIKIKE